MKSKRKKSLPCLTCKDGAYMLNCTCDKLVKFRYGNKLQGDKK